MIDFDQYLLFCVLSGKMDQARRFKMLILDYKHGWFNFMAFGSHFDPWLKKL